MDVLRWARAHGCEWDYMTCFAAAGGGHLAVLHWARAHGCEWDYMTCDAAAGGGHLAVLRWAHEHGCPMLVETCRREALANGHGHVLAWLATAPARTPAVAMLVDADEDARQRCLDLFAESSS